MVQIVHWYVALAPDPLSHLFWSNAVHTGKQMWLMWGISIIVPLVSLSLGWCYCPTFCYNVLCSRLCGWWLRQRFGSVCENDLVYLQVSVCLSVSVNCWTCVSRCVFASCQWEAGFIQLHSLRSPSGSIGHPKEDSLAYARSLYKGGAVLSAR